MTCYFPDSDTGYYEDEYSFFAHDRELELAAQNREDRLEAQAEEMLAGLWEGVDLNKACPPPFENRKDAIDPETGCTAAEMKVEEREGRVV